MAAMPSSGARCRILIDDGCRGAPDREMPVARGQAVAGQVGSQHSETAVSEERDDPPPALGGAHRAVEENCGSAAVADVDGVKKHPISPLPALCRRPVGAAVPSRRPMLRELEGRDAEHQCPDETLPIAVEHLTHARRWSRADGRLAILFPGDQSLVAAADSTAARHAVRRCV